MYLLRVTLASFLGDVEETEDGEKLLSKAELEGGQKTWLSVSIRGLPNLVLRVCLSAHNSVRSPG